MQLLPRLRRTQGVPALVVTTWRPGQPPTFLHLQTYVGSGRVASPVSAPAMPQGFGVRCVGERTQLVPLAAGEYPPQGAAGLLPRPWGRRRVRE